MERVALKTKNNGITLIALIITIIVLLILAGVTINLTLGDNGIFKVAQQAARNYKDAEEKELGLLNDFDNTVDKTINNLQYETLASKAKPGDYVKYDGGNGYTGLWQVLYNDSIYGLQIISADTVTDTFTLGGSTVTEAKASYNSAVDTLNTECRKYVNTKYATSGRCVGSNPLSPDDYITDTVTLEFEYNGTTSSGMKVRDYNFETDYNSMKVATSQNTEGINNIDKIYWLASRFVDLYPTMASFQVRRALASDRTDGYNLWYVDSNGTSNPHNPSHGLRPVITLLTDIKISNGNGSIDDAFELVAK